MENLLSVIWVVRSGQNLESDLIALERMLAGRPAELIIVDDVDGEVLSISDASPSTQVLHHDHARGRRHRLRRAHTSHMAAASSISKARSSCSRQAFQRLSATCFVTLMWGWWGLCRRACRTTACA